jgi:hypothetical protein
MNDDEIAIAHGSECVPCRYPRQMLSALEIPLSSSSCAWTAVYPCYKYTLQAPLQQNFLVIGKTREKSDPLTVQR